MGGVGKENGSNVTAVLFHGISLSAVLGVQAHPRSLKSGGSLGGSHVS